jgi:hypothetical protein
MPQLPWLEDSEDEDQADMTRSKILARKKRESMPIYESVFKPIEGSGAFIDRSTAKKHLFNEF